MRQRLADKYKEDYKRVQKVCLLLYAAGTDPNASRRDIVGLLLALQMSCGMRKTAVLDPNIRFEEFVPTEGTKVRIGDQDEDGVHLEEEREGLFQKTLGYEHCIKQIGVLKDSEQAINNYVDKDDERWVQARELVKPTIILSAEEIVDGVSIVR